MATKDYRKYNLVAPVIKPKHMTLEKLEQQLGKASQQFFMHKLQNIHKLSAWKQEFMLSVLDLLINHSCMADQMRAMIKDGWEMPVEVKSILDTVSKHKRDKHQVIAPIP